jgi:membrane fusion protein (multidrug efflux system)
MKARIVLIAAVVGLVALVAFRISSVKKNAAVVEEKKSDAMLIRTAKVVRTDLDEKIGFTGNVKPHNEVDVFAKLPGRVETLLVQVGDRVKAGQALAVVEHREIGWQAKASEAQVEQAKAAVKLAQAGLDGAQLEYDRTKAIVEGGGAAQAQLDGAKIKLDVARAQFAQASAAVAAAEAAKGLAAQQVANARIESPIDGFVTKKNVNVGSSVGPQMPAFTVQDLATLKLESSVDAVSVVRLARGKSVEIKVDALPGDVFPGRVEILSPALDPVSRRAAIEIAVDNRGGKLLPHMFARADATVGQLSKVLAVPRDAVLETGAGPVVYRVVRAKGSEVQAHVGEFKVEAVHPKVGPADGDLISIIDGLSEGDEVARSGLGNLSDGAAVKVAVSVTQKD